MSGLVTRERRIGALVVLATIAIFAVLLPVTSAADHTIDRQRPLYSDVLETAQLQWDRIQKGMSPMAMHLEEVAAAGVDLDEDTEYLDVTVEGNGIGYCIEGGNKFGDQTAKHCFEGGQKRPTSLTEDCD